MFIYLWYASIPNLIKLVPAVSLAITFFFSWISSLCSKNRPCLWTYWIVQFIYHITNCACCHTHNGFLEPVPGCIRKTNNGTKCIVSNCWHTWNDCWYNSKHQRYHQIFQWWGRSRRIRVWMCLSITISQFIRNAFVFNILTPWNIDNIMLLCCYV